MTVVKHEDAPRVPGPFGGTRYHANTDDLMVVVWEFDHGPADAPDPIHSHPHEQVTYVAEGEVLFFRGEEVHRLGVGDMITVSGDVPHTIQLLSPRVRLIDTFSPIREDFIA